MLLNRNTPKQAAWRALLSKFHRDERGVTLVEIVLVLSIIGVITVVAYQNFGGADAAAKGNRFVQENQFMAARAQQAYRSQPSFGNGRQTSLMCDRNVIPTQFCDATGNAVDANGGEIEFDMSVNSFTLSRQNVPRSVCQEALPEFNTGETTRPTTITTNGTGSAPDTITPTVAQQRCNSDNNTVVFLYDKR